MALELVKLDGVLNIARAESLHEQLEVIVTNATPIELDASDVTRVDTSIIQLLLVFFKDMSGLGVEVSWAGVSDEFLASVKLLGMQSELKLN